MIREAHIMDAPRLVQLGGAYVRESKGHESYPLDVGHAIAVLSTYINSPDCLVLVAVKETTVVGFFYGILSSYPWSPVYLAVDSLLYVTPEERGALYGVSLIRRYEAWAKQKGAVAVILSTASGVDEERTGKLYERLGFKKHGINHRKEFGT